MEERIKECSNVTIECELRIITPDGSEPITHCQNCSFVMGVDVQYPSVEAALMNKKVGDRVKGHIPPEEMFGTYDESLVRDLPRCDYKQERLAPGRMYRQIKNKCLVQFMVKDVKDDVVVADFNDSRAGTSAEFDILVKEVRAATKEEMAPSCAKPPEFPKW
ncbi:MAG: peptidylprolyl isomerase [Syntrophobacteraceae bacterium]